MENVVVWDPEGIFWEGAVVDESTANMLRQRGVALLPCDQRSFKLAGFAGFAKRSWGSGWPLDTAVPQIIAPIAVFHPGAPNKVVHWAARLVSASDEPRAGILRIAAGEQYWTQQRSVISEGTVQKNLVEIATIGKKDAFDGWTVGGQAFIHAGSPGFYGLGIYGFAPGMRVAWLAVTLTP